MGEDKWKNLEMRINRIEKQNRWLTAGCLTCSLAFVCVLTMGQARVRNTLEAQKFVLLSATGDTRAELTTLDGDYPRLSLRSPNGQKEIEVSPLGLSVFDHGMPGKLPLAHYGDVGLYLADPQGQIVLDVGGASVKSPQLTAVPEITMFNKKGSQIWQAP